MEVLLLAVISPMLFWTSLWLVVAAFLLSVVGLLLFGLSARSVNMMTGGSESKIESRRLRSGKALEQLRIIGPKLCAAVFLLGMGWFMNDSWQYHHTFILWDLKVVAEPGDVVGDKTVPEATFYFQRASGPVGQMFPRTFCKKYVPGLHDGYHVEVIAATAEHYPIDCWNVAPTPLGIVYNQGE